MPAAQCTALPHAEGVTPLQAEIILLLQYEYFKVFHYTSK